MPDDWYDNLGGKTVSECLFPKSFAVQTLIICVVGSTGLAALCMFWPQISSAVEDDTADPVKLGLLLWNYECARFQR